MLLDGSESGSETDRERERKIDREKERDSHGGYIVVAGGFCLVIKIWIFFCNFSPYIKSFELLHTLAGRRQFLNVGSGSGSE